MSENKKIERNYFKGSDEFYWGDTKLGNNVFEVWYWIIKKKGRCGMSVQRYPLHINLFKGEGRILIIPFIKHTGGFLVHSDWWFVNIENMEDYLNIGESVFKSIDYIKNSPASSLTPKEQDLKAVWKKKSKYKGWMSFWENNLHGSILFFEDGSYKVASKERSEKLRGGFSDYIKIINLPSTAIAEEIGEAVIDVFRAAEEYYKEKPAYDFFPSKSLELFDDSVLTIKHPRDKRFYDYEDYGVGELYQCYLYLPQEDAESSAEFYIGIASELNCNLDIGNVRSSWERMYGKAEFFEMQEVDYGIFKLRIEMKNKNTHRISYILQMDEYLLLECCMDVHQPNRRKKLDKKLVDLFQEFTLSCKM